MTKNELAKVINEGKEVVDVKASYSDGVVFIGMVDIEHGIDENMIGFMVYQQSNNYLPKAFSRKIYHGVDGNSYIKIDNQKYFMNEFIRTNL